MIHNGCAHIVGDKFNCFSKQKGVYTFSDFIKLLSGNNVTFDKVIIGQGLRNQDRLIINAIHKSERIRKVEGGETIVASLSDTHKHNENNILISLPEENEKEKSYKSQLIVNDDCAEMSDHVTGQHIQGVVFIESARQMMLAVSEKYLLSEEQRQNSYCVLVSLDVKYFKFAFPLKIDIEYIIEELAYKGDRHQAKSRVSFYQNNEIVSEVCIEYLFNNKSYLEKKEDFLAAEAILGKNKNIMMAG